MRPSARALLLALSVTVALSCGGPSSCACGGYTPLAQGAYNGSRVDSAGALRMTTSGFTFVNQNSSTILNMFAPGGQLLVPVPCTTHAVGLDTLTIADEGGLYCTAEACGQMDGKCDANDVPHTITINISALTLKPKAPDVLEATITATVQTGLMHISSVSRTPISCLLLGGGPVKCSIDFDTTRALPATNDLTINIQLTVDQQWDRLLSFNVVGVGGTNTCSGTATNTCLDHNDLLIANAGGSCSFCSAVNFATVKDLLLSQLATSLQDQVSQALRDANCAACGPGGACPSSAYATSACDVDGGVGTCIDSDSGICVPAVIGTEGTLAVGQALAAMGAPPNAAIDLSLVAGGGASANSAGLTVGMRGGFQELAVASCVTPKTPAVWPLLPLPDFDFAAPGAYDVALSMSQQALTEALFHAQQSGAMCLELGNETVAQLDSSALATLLPSLGKLTGGDSKPLRVVLRPVNPPTATVGAGTFDASGAMLEPLLKLNLTGVEIDVYAQLDDAYARLFTLSADLSLPMGFQLDGCAGMRPVLGSLSNAITHVTVKNSDILAEDPTVLVGLVPALLTAAEPALAKGFAIFDLPSFQGFKLKLLAAQGVGQVTGTTSYNHMGFYADVQPSTTVCVPTVLKAAPWQVQRLGAGAMEVLAPSGTRLAVRVGQGFWSEWRTVGSDGRLVMAHPRLKLREATRVELQREDGAVETVFLPTQPPYGSDQPH